MRRQPQLPFDPDDQFFSNMYAPEVRPAGALFVCSAETVKVATLLAQLLANRPHEDYAKINAIARANAPHILNTYAMPLKVALEGVAFCLGPVRDAKIISQRITERDYGYAHQLLASALWVTKEPIGDVAMLTRNLLSKLHLDTKSKP